MPIKPTYEELEQQIQELKGSESACKKAEKTQVQKQEFLDALMDNITDTIYFKDRNSRFTRINKAQANILGLDDVNEALGKTDFDFFRTKHAQDAYKDEQNIIKTNQAVIDKTENIKVAGGKNHWITTTKVPIEGKNGEITGIVGISRDITARKQAEEELKASEEKYRTITETLPGAVYECDLNWTFHYASPGLKELTGFPVFDIINNNVRSYVSLMYEDDIKRINPILEDALKRKDILFFSEYKLNTKSGKIKWVHDSVRIRYDNGGEAIGYEGILLDITERKQAELALIDSEQKYRLLVNNQTDLTVKVDKDGLFQFVSPSYCKLFGKTEDQLLGNAFMPFVHEDDQKSTAIEMEKLYQPPYTAYLEQRAMTIDGWRWLAWMDTAILDENEQVVAIIGAGRDITEQKQAESDRLILENQLNQSQKLEAVGTMVSGISHELNNILQSMFLYGGLVKDELPENDELHTNMEHLLKDGERARDIVKQILTFSRKTSVDMRPQYLHDIVMEVLSLERASFPINIEIKQDIDVNCEMALCDKTQVHQIMINLCNNAQQAMKEQGGILSVSLQQIQPPISNGNPEADYLELIVSDTGHGIDDPDKEKIFDPFFTTKQFGESTGLGLSVVHGLVEMMQGKISVTSKVGEGAKFRILFPVVKAIDESHIATSESTEATETFDKSILLVDDEDSIRQATETVLRRKGFTVNSVADGKQALELFKSKHNEFDIIVTDQSMPILSGADLTLEIRKLKSEIPIILSTGKLGIEDEKEFKDVGITDFIQKPWTANELIARIREIDLG